MDNFSPVQPEHIAATSPEHRAAEAVLSSRALSLSQESGICSELDLVPCNRFQPTELEPSELQFRGM